MQYNEIVEATNHRKPFLDLLGRMAADNGFVWPIRVYVEDSDAAGIVYHANYLKYMERARTEMSRSTGIGLAQMEKAGHVFVVRSLNIEYLNSALVDEQVLATAKVERIGGSSVSFKQSVFAFRPKSSDDGLLEDYEQHLQLLAKADVTVVCVSLETSKAVRLPEDIRKRLEQVQK